MVNKWCARFNSRPYIYRSASLHRMESGRPGNRVIDNILTWHRRRLQEAPLLASSRMLFPARRRPTSPRRCHIHPKRAPSLTAEDAARTGVYRTVIPMLELFKIRSISRQTGIPESTIRKARDRFNETGSMSPRKEEGLQDLIDTHPESTLKNVQGYVSTSFSMGPDISAISKVSETWRSLTRRL